jgi:hypothetical protein
MKDLTTEQIIKQLLAYILDDETKNDDFKMLLDEAQKRI